MCRRFDFGVNFKALVDRTSLIPKTKRPGNLTHGNQVKRLVLLSQNVPQAFIAMTRVESNQFEETDLGFLKKLIDINLLACYLQCSLEEHCEECDICNLVEEVY